MKGWRLLALVIVSALVFGAGVWVGRYLERDTGGGPQQPEQPEQPEQPQQPVQIAPPKETKFTGACFTVQPQPPPGAHSSMGNRYCVREPSPGMWVLIPQTGMPWGAINGGVGSPIPLLGVDNEIGVFKAHFDLEVTPHPQPPTSDHGNVHQQPNRRFMLLIHPVVAPPAKSKATIQQIAGTGGEDVHGGTAHADAD